MIRIRERRDVLNNKKKQILYNAVMLAAIVIMVLCAVFTTQKIKTSETEKNRADDATVTDTVSSVYEDNISDDDEEKDVITEENIKRDTETIKENSGIDSTSTDDKNNAQAHETGQTVSVNSGAATSTEDKSFTDEEPATEKNTVENTVTEAVSGETVTEAAQMTCTVQINCGSILDNMDKLKEGKADYVPASGTVLGMVTVTFTEGESAIDVLKRVCSSYGIQLEYSYTPVYGSYYVEGINNLYESDCGSGSGWHYYINGSSPGYGCSSYNMSDGDSMVWNYYCQ